MRLTGTLRRRLLPRVLAGSALLAPAAWAQHAADLSVATSQPVRQSQDDAWWTGPMLANSAATLPRGHFLIEPYLYDATSAHADGWGSLTYMLYGLTDRLTVGLVPVLGYNRVDGGPDSSHVGFGDVSVQAQYRLTRSREGSSLPTISIQLQQTLPSGKHDRLGNRPSVGLSSGATTTTLQINTQTYFWLANGRILHMRLNVGQSVSGKARVEDVSVYGTTEGFRGTARPGNAFLANAAWEYSLSRRWVLAFDVTYRRHRDTRLVGFAVPGDAAALSHSSGSGEAFGFAPAVEYSWSPSMGVLLGARVVTGHNTTTTITPAIAFNYVH